MTVVSDQPFQILLDLAREGKIDPWDVDIDKLTDIYMDRLLKMEELDLRTSGRAILSASILLHMKSEHPPSDGTSDGRSEEIIDDIPLEFVDLGPLTVIRRSPRKITLSELVEGLKETLEKPAPMKAGKPSKPKGIVRLPDEFHTKFEEKLEEFYEKIVSLASHTQTLKFTQLISESSKKETARALVLALFLSNKGKISLHQDEPFGEIYIQLKEKGVKSEGR